jgi:hypothetical protein
MEAVISLHVFYTCCLVKVLSPIKKATRGTFLNIFFLSIFLFIYFCKYLLEYCLPEEDLYEVGGECPVRMIW